MRKKAAAAAIGLLLSASPAFAEEGMWTFDNFPAVRMAAEMGWAPDQAWLGRVMAGTARLPGCSGSNVSAEGLVLTNQHCVIACVQALSSARSNTLETGFTARARSEERRCPNLNVMVLDGIADVTARVDAAAAAAAPGAFAGARNSEISRIENECASAAAHCEVVMLYQGARYALYRYRAYHDVRLVFAPEHAMAAFGGEADNFNFPRYCADFAFLRLYQNGAPAATPRHLSMRFTPLAAGDIVLTAGNPGPTSRLASAAELGFERDVNLPWRLQALAEARARLMAYSALGAGEARTAAAALRSAENAHVALSGRQRALAESFARIVGREADLRARVGRNRAAQRELGDAWGEIERAQGAYRSFFFTYQLLEARAGEGSQLFAWARDIVRGAAEREKPDAARLARYAETRLAGVARGLRTEQRVDRAFEQLNLGLWLSQMSARLGPAPARRVLGAESPEALGQALSNSRLSDGAYRTSLWEGGAAAVAASDDPMIVFVRGWDEDARAARARFVAEVEAPVAHARERIAIARFRAFGETQYPEASFSPRLSYGRAVAWTQANRAIGPFTAIGGLYARATGAAPFALSQSWIAARARLDAETHFNLSSSNDVVSGNSGSPLLDREGRVVGVVFDGNSHSLGGEYFYDGAINRAVSVAAPLIRAALLEVYAMGALAAELEG